MVSILDKSIGRSPHSLAQKSTPIHYTSSICDCGTYCVVVFLRFLHAYMIDIDSTLDSNLADEKVVLVGHASAFTLLALSDPDLCRARTRPLGIIDIAQENAAQRLNMFKSHRTRSNY